MKIYFSKKIYKTEKVNEKNETYSKPDGWDSGWNMYGHDRYITPNWGVAEP